jgi:excisionase family DNA binding protein
MANSATEMIFTLRWYTVAQLAQLLNYEESKVRMLIITGQLRSNKDGSTAHLCLTISSNESVDPCYTGKRN